jgi:diaminohydroxyphosphoribosylaminopyrimidine deaminase/5-amino-6-(5-phosphoribosylamino)uracil reductase
VNDAQRYLDLAARLASRARGYVEPNPLVGAVIVREDGSGGGRIIGMGHHRRYGGPHAEVEALADSDLRRESVRGATLYCTLEPCNHHGKQPPCVDAILAAGIGRVVCARPDPNPLASGGADRLRASGVPVEFTDASVEAVRLSDPFVKRVATGLPWTIAKWAQTIDGRIATRTGESKWISSERSRRRVHRLRARVDAVLTAVGTLLADDPVLTARGGWTRRRVARRAVIDPGLEIPEDAQMVRTLDEAPLTVFCADRALTTQPRKSGLLAARGVEIVTMGGDDEVSVDGALRHLGQAHMATNVLVEAGPGLLGRLFDADLIDEAHVYIAPTLMGDESAKPAVRGRVVERLTESKPLRLQRTKAIGEDVLLEYRRV